MDLSQLANLGEAISGFAVIGSVIFLAYELRASTKILKASKAAQSSEQWASFNQTTMQSTDVIGIIQKAFVEKSSLADFSIEEAIRFDAYCRAVMQLAEAEYFLFEAGIHPGDVYENRITNIRSWMKLPAWSDWWEREKSISMYSSDFINNLFPTQKVETKG